MAPSASAGVFACASVGVVVAYSLLRKAAEITGWTQEELSELTGFSRPQISAIVTERTPEYLTAPQIARVLGAVRLFVDQARLGLEEMESFR